MKTDDNYSSQVHVYCIVNGYYRNFSIRLIY